MAYANLPKKDNKSTLLWIDEPARPSTPTVTDADVMAVGRHCSSPDCRQLDFLPFQCTGCKMEFCLDHRTFKAHSCPYAPKESLGKLPNDQVAAPPLTQHRSRGAFQVTASP